jgi:hypothetical protein
MVALAAAALPGGVDAGHGGGVQLRAAPAGPYRVSVWTQPIPPRPGPWQVDVAVMDAAGAPVAGAVVHVRAAPRGSPGPPTEAEARREADPLGIRYRAELALGSAGAWDARVQVAGPRGTGTVAFPVDVAPASPAWWPLAAAGAAALAAAAWLVARGRRRAPAPLPARPAGTAPR